MLSDIISTVPTVGRTPQMYTRFTDNARNAFRYANREAEEFRHEFIGSAHILLGLLAESSGTIEILKDAHVDCDAVRFLATELLKSTPKSSSSDDSRKVVAAAMQEVRRLEHDVIDAPHILLGILTLPDCLAAIVFDRLCSDVEPLRRAALSRVAHLPKVVQHPWESYKDHAAIKPLLDRLDCLRELKERAVASSNFEEAARLRDEGGQLIQEIHETMRHIDDDSSSGDSTG